MTMIPVFDGHNDFLLRLLRAPEKRGATWLEGDGSGHLDLPRMRKGGFAGGFFAIYIPSPPEDRPDDRDDLMDNPPYALDLPRELDLGYSQTVALAMAGHLLWMERSSEGRFRICRTASEVRETITRGAIAAIMHMEGAEAIDPDLDSLYSFHAMGLRSIGPVWSRPTAFGHGVPFVFPGTPDTGPGLTDAGKRLVKTCNELRVMIDLSHLNEKGFDDVAKLSDAPLVATHSNAHAVTPSTRNLTDRQLSMIAESGGMVGLNFATVFLRPDGRRSSDMTLEPMLRHLDHLIGILGEDHVGMGSDFDGAAIPDPITDVSGLPALTEAMRVHGYSEELVRKLCLDNWLGLLDRTFRD
ncbi:dipeptidase AC [Hoeflea marina]|uniref:Dipeptidase AC n=1 Tax=Hoeflea marina TaxID=274592 RepID=A0A317PMV3_9HYPH|nr:dipeptidase [Hoeflea marina]PWW02097.1 dipeptidase AC [Hoeflea marina]